MHSQKEREKDGLTCVAAAFKGSLKYPFFAERKLNNNNANTKGTSSYTSKAVLKVDLKFKNVKTNANG